MKVPSFNEKVTNQPKNDKKLNVKTQGSVKIMQNHRCRTPGFTEHPVYREFSTPMTCAKFATLTHVEPENLPRTRNIRCRPPEPVVTSSPLWRPKRKKASGRRLWRREEEEEASCGGAE